jgi:DNA-binding LytR/AlgR family response regulator
MLDPEDVIYCHAEGNYTEIYTVKGEKEIVTTNLGKLEKSLPKNIFYRMSRFHIVNIHFIKRIDRKKQLCELGVNGTLHSLSIPKNKIKELETRLTGGL